MEIQKVTPNVKKELNVFLKHVGLAVGFGFSVYTILYLVLVSLALPVITSEGATLVFWPMAVSILFVVEAYIADAIFRPLKKKAVSGGLLSASLICMMLLIASPLLFLDQSVRSSLLNLTVMILAPFMGMSVGGIFVSRRAEAKIGV
jgi:hypothetical protein